MSRAGAAAICAALCLATSGCASSPSADPSAPFFSTSPSAAAGRLTTAQPAPTTDPTVIASAGTSPVAAAGESTAAPGTLPATPQQTSPRSAAPGGGAAPGATDVVRPVSRLTPGAVASTDTAAVCARTAHVHASIPRSLQEAVFSEYHLDIATQRAEYGLDYLIPVELGGAPVRSNLWPMPYAGTGFHQKQKLNARLHTLVCRGSLSLTQAQRAVAANWYALWRTYAA